MMILSVYLVLLFQAWVTPLILDSLCPISRSLTYSNQGNFHYPTDLYFPGLRYESNVSCLRDVVTLTNVTCPLKSLGCPLVKVNLVDALHTAKLWPKLTSLCHLKKVFLSPKLNSSVIVLGGSVTLGSDSNGCCSSPECMHHANKRCSWVHHFDIWVNSCFAANITVHNLAWPGANSVFMSEIIDETLTEIGVFNFSSRDLIVLDFSVNDNVESIPINDIKLKQGLEKLVRYLISKAINGHGIPHIILLEAAVDVIGPPENSYHHVYRAIAQHYGLHLFSYADILQSQYSQITQSSIYNQLSFRLSNNYHPPWHGQLLYADFIAGVLSFQMNQCEHSAGTFSSINSSHHTNLVRWNGASTKLKSHSKSLTVGSPEEHVALLSLLVPNDEMSNVCVKTKPSIIRMSYNDVLANISVGSFYTQPSNTWQLALDKKERGGFIMKIAPESHWKHIHDSKLIFPLGITVNQLRNMSILIQVQFMRSYADSGIVSLGVCGVYFKDLDALWTDYRTYRYTLSDVYSTKLILEWCTQKCTDEDQVELSVMYKVKSNKEDNSNMSQLVLSLLR